MAKAKKPKVEKLSETWIADWKENHTKHQTLEKQYLETCLSIDRLTTLKADYLHQKDVVLNHLQTELNKLEKKYGHNSEVNLEEGTINATYDF